MPVESIKARMVSDLRKTDQMCLGGWLGTIKSRQLCYHAFLLPICQVEVVSQGTFLYISGGVSRFHSSNSIQCTLVTMASLEFVPTLSTL